VSGAPLAGPAVLRETRDWLVIDKPVAWHSVRGATSPNREGLGVLATWLANTHPELAVLPDSGLVHRLDRDTSGCIVAARTAAAYAALARRFRTGSDVRKIYLARMTTGIAEHGSVTLYFNSRYRRSARMTVARTGEARHAGRVRWHVRGRDARRGDLVEIELIGAGKRHEIRAGFAHLGHPLIGDVLYGGRADTHAQLHAWRIELDGEVIEGLGARRLTPALRCAVTGIGVVDQVERNNRILTACSAWQAVTHSNEGGST